MQSLSKSTVDSASSSGGIRLTLGQIKAYSIMKSCENLFLTGMGGTGKSELIKHFNREYRFKRNIAITSTTGTSALLIGGYTLHSFLGIGLGQGSVSALVSKISKNNWLMKRWNTLDTLVIDEVSMLSPDLFDKLEEIARIVRTCDEPFGGIQLILTGDFLQLPCVDSNNFCFHSDSWSKCIKKIVYLTEIIRQESLEFQICLNHIRLGETPSSVKEIIESRIGANLENGYGITPTIIYPLNCDVDRINDEELDKLAEGETFYEYEMKIKTLTITKNPQVIVDKFKRHCLAPPILQLCVGAQVMLLYNKDLKSQLANGSRGVVINFIDDLPVVRFLNGVDVLIDYHDWDVEENDKKVLRITQIPLKIAYAITAHKSQGQSLDYAEIDLSNIFEYGQAYVALSRIKSIEGLSIRSIDWDKIKAHPEARRFYDELTG